MSASPPWPVGVHDPFTADVNAPSVGGLISADRGEQRGFARAAWAEQRDDFAALDAQRDVFHGHDLGVARCHKPWSGRWLRRLDFGFVRFHQDKTLFGFDVHRLPNAKQTRQHGNGEHDDREHNQVGPLDHDETRETREGILPQPPRQSVAERAHEQRLLEDQSNDDAVARADEFEQRNVVNLVERQRVEISAMMIVEIMMSSTRNKPSCRLALSTMPERSRSFCCWVE